MNPAYDSNLAADAEIRAPSPSSTTITRGGDDGARRGPPYSASTAGTNPGGLLACRRHR